MLDYRILSTKPKITTADKDEYLDLLANNYKMPESKFNGQFVVVNQYYVARPDLLSLAAYGTDEYGDIICKINGISNPFELNEDDMIYLPDIEFITETITPVYNPCKRANKKEQIDTTETVDNRKQLYEKRTANEMTINHQNYIIDKTLGLVFY